MSKLLTVLLITAMSSMATASDSLIVVDSRGAKLGPVIDVPSGSDGVVKVPFRVRDRVVVVEVNRKGFEVGMSKIMYDPDHSPPCSGQPYFFAPQPNSTDTPDLDSFPIGRTSIVGYPGATLYVRDHSVPVTDIRRGLYREPGGVCIGTIQIGQPPLPAIPIKPVVDLNSRFVPPFHLEGSADLIQLREP